METEPSLTLSPILTSYSSDNLTEIAARVVPELTAESDHSDLDDGGGAGADFEFTYEGESNYPRIVLENHADELNRNEGDGDDEDEDEDDDFEFAVSGKDAVSSPISADEIFCNGQIRPIYPVFNRNLYFDGFGFVRVGSNCEKSPLPPPIPRLPPRVRIPLGKLMREDLDPPSCSSSEADELDGIPAEIYCIWKPKTEEELSSVKCKKSNSLGSSSKRWKFRNLLHRSSSEGKDMLVFIPPTDNRGKRNVDKPEEKESKKEDAAAETERGGDGGEAAAAVDQRMKATGVGERKASYLPYRKDLVGLFSNLHPF